MAYEFKKLSDVAAVETPADTANVLIEEDGVIKKVAKEKVAPVVEALPLPETATVGQMFKVSEVDENGKVTKVEAVDMPSGNEYDAIVAELTVDDDTRAWQLVDGVGYSAIVGKIRNGKIPNVLVISSLQGGINVNEICEGQVTIWKLTGWEPIASDDSIALSLQMPCYESMTFYYLTINPDNTVFMWQPD